MHLVGAELGTLMPQMGEVERVGIVLGLAEIQRFAAAVVMAADQDVIGSGESRAVDQAVHSMQMTMARGAAPIMEGVVEGSLGAHKRWLVGRTPMVPLAHFSLAHPHGRLPLNNPVNCLVRWVTR